MSSTKRGRPSAAGRADPQALALADREAVGAVVACRAPRRSRGRRSRRCPAPSFSRSQPAVSPSEMKQMSWLSGFCATCRPAALGLGAHRPTCGESPSGNSECAQLLLGEHAEHVGLVLARVDGAVHPDQPVVAGDQPRVVAGGDRVEAERDRAVEHRGELDLLVAAQAGVRRAAGGVLRHEVLDHVLVEAVAQVPDVEGDPDHVGGAAGVVGVLDRAAAARPGAVATAGCGTGRGGCR